MAAQNMTVTVDVRTRPMLARVVRFPFVARRHFVVIRRHGGSVFLSLVGAWILAGRVVTLASPKGKRVAVNL